MIGKWTSAGVFTPTRSTPWDSSWPKYVEDRRRGELLGYFTDRFGIGLSSFEGFRLLESRRTYWLLTQSPHVEKLKSLKVHTAGIPVLRKSKTYLKPTTAALQMFGFRASRNVVNLDRQQLDRLLTDNQISLSLSMTPGYVILAHHRHILGCGLYIEGRLLSQIPRSYRAPR